MNFYDQRAAGKRLKTERERLGVPVEKCRHASCVDWQTYINFELGEDLPSVEQLLGLASAGIDIAFVVFEVRRSDFLKLDRKLILSEFVNVVREMTAAEGGELPSWLQTMMVLISYERVMAGTYEWQNSEVAERAGIPCQMETGLLKPCIHSLRGS